MLPISRSSSPDRLLLQVDYAVKEIQCLDDNAVLGPEMWSDDVLGMLHCMLGKPQERKAGPKERWPCWPRCRDLPVVAEHIRQGLKLQTRTEWDAFVPDAVRQSGVHSLRSRIGHRDVYRIPNTISLRLSTDSIGPVQASVSNLPSNKPSLMQCN